MKRRNNKLNGDKYICPQCKEVFEVREKADRHIKNCSYPDL